MAGDDHLPADIWRKVFVRLPAKSILRCRSVCKSRYSLVSCLGFISYYSTKNLNNNRNHLLLQIWSARSVVISISSLDESCMESREHDDFPEFNVLDLQFVGSCNGLICLSKYTKNVDGLLEIRLFIWNPTIGKKFELPSRRNARSASYIGFGFDSKTSDYKVLCIMGEIREIFDLSKGVWRSISPIMPPWVVGNTRCQECYLDGSVHWSGQKHPNSSETILRSFNMNDECFQDIQMPALLTVTNPLTLDKFIHTNSMTFGGLIYVIAWNMRRSCSVWVMKEYGVAESWTKVSHIDMPSTLYWPGKSLSWEDGEVLMPLKADEFGPKRNLVMYNTEKRTFECVSSVTTYVRDMCLYEESLVLM